MTCDKCGLTHTGSCQDAIRKHYEGEIERLKAGIYAVVAELVNKKPALALNLARVVMYGGSVLSALDCENPKRLRDKVLKEQT